MMSIDSSSNQPCNCGYHHCRSNDGRLIYYQPGSNHKCAQSQKYTPNQAAHLPIEKMPSALHVELIFIELLI